MGMRCLFCAGFAGAWLGVCFSAWSAPLAESEARLLRARLVPQPQTVAFSDGPDVVLDRSLQVTLAVSRAQETPLAEKQTQATFKAWFRTTPKLVVQTSDRAPQKPDAYRLTASGGALTIEAADAGGVRNALRTLRQLAEPVRGTRTLAAYFVPETRIEDAPAMAFRGFHICWFPENTPEQIERDIRLAAYYKMNEIVLESWGTFVSEKHPELSWPNSRMTTKEVRRLVGIANDLGVTLIPQFNIFGHAAGARSCTGKHAVLDVHPELQPLFEPLGWTWCLSNPETVRLLEERVQEMHDAFGRPPYFHVGCDEAEDMGTCERCRRSDYPRVVAAFLTRIHDVLAARGCRTMVWHDMLVRRDDPRWKGYVANGSAQAEGLLDALPKDLVICDWQYDAPKKTGETWPTMRYFKAKGFSVLACPWENAAGYASQSALVREAGLDGMLCTTWHHLYGPTLGPIYFRAAAATWGAPSSGGYSELVFSQHLRQVGWDVPVSSYEETGFYATQLPEKSASPR